MTRLLSLRDTLIRGNYYYYVPHSQRLCRRRSAPPSPIVVRCPMLCFRLSPLTASHPQDGAGNNFAGAASAAPVWRNPPPTPTLALGTLCPPVGRFAASACGASGFAALVSHPISGPCRVRILLSVPPILLTCDQRAACLPNRLARSRRANPALGRQNRAWTSIRRTSVGSVPSICLQCVRPAPTGPRKVSRAGPPSGGAVRSTPERTCLPSPPQPQGHLQPLLRWAQR